MTASPRRGVAVAKTADDRAWRGRALIACSLVVLAFLAAAALNLDWSADPAMAAGQMVGMAAPILMLAVGLWAVMGGIGRKD